MSLRMMLGLSHAVAYRRLARLSEYGMVRPEAPFRGSAALFVPTRLGLREVLGLDDAKSPAVSAWSYNHQLHVGRVLAQLHAHGVAWESSRVTRRRRVAAEQAGDLIKSRRLALWLPRSRRTHLPDALIWPSDRSREHDRPIAVEVELAQKSRARIDEILGEYAISIGFRGVVYVCDPNCHRAVLAAATNRPSVSVTTLDEFGRGIALPTRPGRKPFDEPRATPLGWNAG